MQPSDDRINAEAVNDRVKLMLHRLVARRLASDPGLISRARDVLARQREGGPVLEATDEWNSLLNLGIDALRREIVRRDERMTRLRISSPFATVIDVDDPSFRRRMWRKARAGLTIHV